MTVIDSTVWIAAWRGRRDGAEVRQLVGEKVIIGVPGIVLQEVVAGARDTGNAIRLIRQLQRFELLLATERHHFEAGGLAAQCRRAGVTVSATDALIAATAMLAGAELLTHDRDFLAIARCAPLNVRILAT